MATTTSKIVTYEEWLRMPETKRKEEVVDGEIITMPPNKWSHAEIVDELHAILVVQFDRKAVRVTSSCFGLVICAEPLTVLTVNAAAARLLKRTRYGATVSDIACDMSVPGWNWSLSRAAPWMDLDSTRSMPVIYRK